MPEQAKGGKKPGAGRKPIENKMKAYSFKCAPEDYEQIKQYASEQGLSISAYIRNQCTRRNNS